MTSPIPSSVYGPVQSWRLGKSLGIDVLCIDSICSFECVYCQLGKINRVTSERGIFVSTDKVLEDLAAADWRSADVITFSGSGEPTLAANLGEIIAGIRKLTGKPIIVLTNSTLLNDRQVREDLSLADRVFCKLDAWNEDTLRRVDRPAPGITFDSIISGIRRFREEYRGFLAIQTMILRAPSEADLASFAETLRSIAPDEVQVNIPTRPVPREYFTETRGNEVEFDPAFTLLKTIGREELKTIAARLGELAGVPVVAR